MQMLIKFTVKKPLKGIDINKYIKKDFQGILANLFQQLSQVMSLRTTEMGDGEEQIVAVRLANLELLCQKKGVKTMPEKVIRDCIEKFDLGK